MPSTAASLFAATGLQVEGTVGWGERVSERRPGVYAVSLFADPKSTAGATSPCSVDPDRTWSLLLTRPELRVNGRRPDPAELADRVCSFWLPDEVVLYVGLAGMSLRTRVDQYYRTALGARRPHAGGWFLKLLANLDELWVHFAACEDPAGAEDAMLARFCKEVSHSTLERCRDPAHPFPFANLEWPRGVRKLHGITGARGETSPRLAQPSRPVAVVARSSGRRGSRGTAAPTARGFPTQPVTAVDLSHGRIRIPRGAAKATLPQTPTRVSVVLRGEQLGDCSYNPRFDPPPERSGVIGIGRHVLPRLVQAGEALMLSVIGDGTVVLT